MQARPSQHVDQCSGARNLPWPSRRAPRVHEWPRRLIELPNPSAYLSDTVEALMIAGQAGLDVVEVPVTMRERQGGAPSAGPLKSAAYLLRLYLVIFISPLRPIT